MFYNGYYIPKKSIRMNCISCESLNQSNADRNIRIASTHGFTFIIHSKTRRIFIKCFFSYALYARMCIVFSKYSHMAVWTSTMRVYNVEKRKKSKVRCRNNEILRSQFPCLDRSLLYFNAACEYRSSVHRSFVVCITLNEYKRVGKTNYPIVCPRISRSIRLNSGGFQTCSRCILQTI